MSKKYLIMKANELRIGNIVERYTDVFGRGWSWTNTSHEDIYSIACGHEDKYRPIPLTEEWLVKFGFEEIIVEGYPIYQNKKGLVIEYYKDESVFLILDYEVRIKHVHQLQNLYFALTNEELTIND